LVTKNNDPVFSPATAHGILFLSSLEMLALMWASSALPSPICHSFSSANKNALVQFRWRHWTFRNTCSRNERTCLMWHDKSNCTRHDQTAQLQ